MRFHYREDGEIIAWDNADGGEPLLGSRIAIAEFEGQFDPTRFRVNVETSELEQLSEDVTSILRGPSTDEVKQAIAFELISTDAMMVPDRDVPDRDEWITYRKTLRALSKLATANDMLMTWPLRPDDHDAVAALRERLPK